MKKRYEIILAAGLILTILMSNTIGFIRDGRRLEQLRGSVLRLHILADSDSERDQQLKLKVGGWVQVSLEFSVNDRKTQDGRDFKAQRVRILNISPLWGHEETDDKAF